MKKVLLLGVPLSLATTLPANERRHLHVPPIQADPIFEQNVDVAARDATQLNDVAIPRIENAHMTVDYDTYVWIRISRDQPFLGYVSSVFEGGAPGSMPFEIFTPRLAGTTTR